MTSRMLVPAELIVAVLLAWPVAATGVEVQKREGVTYVSGGVGSDEKQALEAMSGRFNLKLTMALNTGHFVSGVHVRIQDPRGQTMLATEADGPLLFAQLPAGTYTVSCSLNGKELKQSTQISGGKQQQLTFTWPSE